MTQEKRLVEVYTGDGRGKTTAAMGLVLRAVGHGLHCCIIQFLKSIEHLHYGEQRAYEYLPNVEMEQYGRPGWTEPDKLSQEDRELARRGFERAKEVVMGGEYDLVVLDELNTTVSMNLIPLEDVLGLIEEKPDSVEVVLTGRGAAPEVVEAADLVTEMRMIKHPYEQGIYSREGFDY